MGLIDTLIKKVGVNTGSSEANQNAISSIYELINSSQVGGIEGLARKMSGKGLGNIVDSWISTGKNKKINANQLGNALGSDIIDQFASRLGISGSAATLILARYLPLIIDKLTPEGKVSSSKQMNIQDIMGSILKK